MPGRHAIGSPSGAVTWMPCVGSPALSRGLPDSAGDAAADGDHTHGLAAQWLTDPSVESRNPTAWRQGFRSPELFEAAQAYVKAVARAEAILRQEGAFVVRYVEKPVSLTSTTGEAGAEGTPDTVLVATWADGRCIIWVLDLKCGFTEVPDDTPQLPIYALAAIDTYGGMFEVIEVRTTVVQPRLRSEFATLAWKPDELTVFAKLVREKADRMLALYEAPETLTLEDLNPGEKQCKWCRAARAAKCPAYDQYVHATVFGEITPIDDKHAIPQAEDTYTGPLVEFQAQRLPLFLSRIPAIEKWIDYVKSASYDVLAAGRPLDDGQGHAFKLVQGRKGDRAFTDEAAVVVIARAHGVGDDVLYAPRKLQTPTQIEKATRAKPQVYEALKGFVTQSAGKPSVAPMDDPRPAYVLASTDEMIDYTAPEM